MFVYSRPSNDRYTLFEFYKYMSSKVARLAGCDVKVECLRHDVPFKRVDSNEQEVVFYLPSRNFESAIARIVLNGDARSDKFSRHVVSIFVDNCMKAISNTKRPWHLKAFTIRNHSFFLDNIVFSLLHRGAQKYYTIDVFNAIRDSLKFRYEGSSLPLGVIYSINWHNVNVKISDIGGIWLNFKEQADLSSALARKKRWHKYSDGEGSFLSITPEGLVKSLVCLPQGDCESQTPIGWELVPQEYHGISRILSGRDIVFSATADGDIWVFSTRFVLKWANDYWHRYSGYALSGYIPVDGQDEKNIIIKIIVELAKSKTGAIISFPDDVEKLKAYCSGGVLADFNRDCIGNISNINIDFIKRLLSIDGCVTILNNGNVIDAGQIVKVDSDFHIGDEGARTLAAAFSSKFGVSIKVSDDGPITIFRGGEVVKYIA